MTPIRRSSGLRSRKHLAATPSPSNGFAMRGKEAGGRWGAPGGMPGSGFLDHPIRRRPGQTCGAILLALAAIALPFGGAFARSAAETSAFKNLFGENVAPLGHPLNVNMGDMKGGKLYVYDKYGVNNYEATYVHSGKKYIIVSENEDEVGHMTPVSIFNVRHEGKYCLVFLIVHSAPWSSDVNYDGSVYCMSGDQVIRNDTLSGRLDGVEDAKHARAALKPLL